MSMTNCHECQHQISTTAKSCPSCGAKVPRTKWWLWIPLGLIVLVIAYGLSIPEYESRALRHRSVCEEIAGPLRRHECQQIYDNEMAAGRASARLAGSTPGYIAPADRALAEEAARGRRAEDEKTLAACRAERSAKRVQYDAKMRSGEYWEASLVLRRCSELQPEEMALRELVATAEQKQYIAEIESKASSVDVRNQAIDALVRDYPEVGKKYVSLRR